MKQTVIFLILLFVFPVMAFAASPMVEKHIFLPEKASGKKNILSDDKIKESLLFTGVVISEKGRYALIKEKVKRSGKSLGSYYKKIINYCKQRIDGKKNKEKN